MIYVIASILVIGLMVLLSTKLKSFIFKTKDAKLVKEDQALKVQADVLQEEIKDLKTPLKAEDLTPEQIEDFWKKKGK
jgi:hypothetical protein